MLAVSKGESIVGRESQNETFRMRRDGEFKRSEVFQKIITVNLPILSTVSHTKVIGLRINRNVYTARDSRISCMQNMGNECVCKFR